MYKCKICGKKYTELAALYNHIESKHKDMIPKDMTVQQYYYYMKTGKMNGNCVMCKNPTSWNHNTGKYNRFCGNSKCKDEYVKIMKSRMVAKYGKTHLLNDPNKQREMLANRSISGVYKWSDGKHETTYTGSYELDFLKTLDNFFNWDPEDISMPSPHTYTYKYEGEDRFYIPDAFIHSLDLEIEIKDGGDNPNNHHKIQDVDKEKEKLKDEVLCSQKAFHYVKITNKNYENLFRFLKEIKKEFEKHGDETKIPRIFKIEDIKGTNIKPVKESTDLLEEGLHKTANDLINKFEKFSNVKYQERDYFFSLRYDLAKNNPKELQELLTHMIKAARFKDDLWYVEKLSKKADDYYQLRIKKHPEIKDEYQEYYNWLKNGGFDKDISKKRKKLKESVEIIEENILLSSDNIELNLEKFGKDFNTLYITGLGGSGKSTIIKEYAAKYKAEALEFDAVTSALIRGLENLNKNKIHPIILEYLETQKPYKLNGFDDPNFVVESVKFLDWFENRVANENTLYILEGMQLFICFDPERFRGRPMVVMGTSVTKSMYRSTLRVYKRSEGDILKTFKFFLKTLQRTQLFIKNDRQISNLINTLNEAQEIIEEKFEPDKFLVWFDKPLQKLKGGKIKIYHGSLVEIKGNIIDPISFNVGATKFSDPRWSTYFWDNREDALNWASVWVLSEVHKEVLMMGHNGKNLIGLPEGKVDKEFAKELVNKAAGNKFYVYECEIDIDKLEIGSCPSIKEYTVSEPVNIIKKHKYEFNIEILKRFYKFVPMEEIYELKKNRQTIKNLKMHRGILLNNILDNSRDSYRGILRTELKNGNINYGDDLSGYKYSINRHVKQDTYGLHESYIINTMKESSISIPQMSYFLQNEYEEEMKNYLNTYKKYYNLMLKEQPAAVKHINEDIRQCLIVIDGLASKGVENNLVQFAKDDLGEIVKASKKGKPVKVVESMVDNIIGINDKLNDVSLISVNNGSVSISNDKVINGKIIYNPTNALHSIFTLRDTTSKLIIEDMYVIQRDKVGIHCSITPYYQDIKEEGILEFQIILDEDIDKLAVEITEGVNITSLYKFNDKEYKFIREACLKLFGSYPKDIKIK